MTPQSGSEAKSPEASDPARGAGSASSKELHDLVVEHGDAIYRLAYSICRDSSLAEDIAQDTMVKAWLALPSFRGDSSLRSWLMRIAHNTAISTLRSRRAIPVDPLDIPEASETAEISVERRVQSSEAMAAFLEALDELDEMSRGIVVLREIEGFAYDEIAEVMGIPLPTVKTRLMRSRRRLSAVLKEWV